MPLNGQKEEQTKSARALESEESVSEPQQEAHPSNSVYDFLYHDARRVASFLAQFGSYGVLSQVKATESSGQAATSRTLLGGGFNVPLVAQGQATVDATTSDDERDTAERTYDPLWTHARTLLNYLNDDGMDLPRYLASSIGTDRSCQRYPDCPRCLPLEGCMGQA